MRIIYPKLNFENYLNFIEGNGKAKFDELSLSLGTASFTWFSSASCLHYFCSTSLWYLYLFAVFWVLFALFLYFLSTLYGILDLDNCDNLFSLLLK